ncbi:hypothetical protein OIT44_02770 [Weissella ceti]|uniref:XkdX family protein n=1 Tax=Weissella ceti TaxID=759620 RepID=A0ABT3E3K9_9LACO|nr:hypothetical protein [Weissella ceti]MCW0952994.1 hypothetical protein [Weissella ceti]QVK11540.1 hypothetical protein KHQ31_04780 [Weissella ceti]
MRETYKRLYRMGLMTPEEVYDIVVYLPTFKLEELDYEYITGQKWPSNEDKKDGI